MSGLITDRERIRSMIDAEDVVLGRNVTFAPDVHVSAIRDTARRIVIGDNVFVGKNVYIAVPELVIGDFAIIHQSCRLSGYEPLSIGHNCWFDQNSIFNSTARLRIGNNVCVSAYCQLWTHFRWGDTVIGCQYELDEPLTVHDDAYFGGMSFVGPCVVGEKSLVLGGSVVTRDVAPNRVYAGNPAVDITHKMKPPFREVPVAERRRELEARIGRFFEDTDKWSREGVEVVESWDFEPRPDVTYFNVADRTYSKRGHEIETDLMLHLLPTAKFLPREV